MASELNAVFTARKMAIVERDGAQFEALIRLQAPDDGAQVRMPLSLTTVIDRSGSMNGGRVEAAKACTIDLIKRLRDDDEIGVVIYDHEISVLLPLTPAPTAKALIEPLTHTFDARGNTDLHGGWLAGAAMLAPRTSAKRVCRVVLLSDGKANCGTIDYEAITAQVGQLAQAGVSTTTVGIGLGFNELLMSGMATAGRGSALFGERPEDLAEPFESELGLLANLIARDVRLQQIGKLGAAAWKVHNAYVRDEKLGWSLPSVAAGAEAWVAVSIPMQDLLQARRRGEDMAMRITFTSVDANGAIREQSAIWNLNDLPVLSAAEYDAMPAEDLVVRRFDELAVAAILTQAREAVLQRDWKAVAALLEDVQQRAKANVWLQSVVRELEKMLQQRDAGRMEKEMHYQANFMAARAAFRSESAGPDDMGVPTFLRRRPVRGRKDSE